jgi:hypothetical protein
MENYSWGVIINNFQTSNMKRKFTSVIALTFAVCFMSSCATVFGGRVTEMQRTRPAEGQPARAIRPVALIADVLLFWPGAIVDFATGAIYKPQAKAVTPPVEAKN